MNILDSNEKELLNNNMISIFGAFCQQMPQTIISFNKLLNTYNFDTIIECGGHTLGLSTFFALYCWGSKFPAKSDNPGEPSLYVNSTHHKLSKDFYTFDFIERDTNRKQMLYSMGGSFQKRDFLTNQEDIEYIGGLISEPNKRVLLLCDGGNKVQEFNQFAKYLNRGSFICAHDWSKNEEEFTKNVGDSGWSGGLEVQWSDIQDTCEKYDIVQLFPEEFNKNLWFCGVRT